MSKKPQISVVMPAFNASRYLNRAVESVLAQSIPDWELLIVDDASTDETGVLAANWALRDSRIQSITMPVNSGVAAARNRALDVARGRYIAFLDSDDLWDPLKLETQLRCMREAGALICYSAYRRIDEKGNVIGSVRIPGSIDYKTLLRSNFIGNLTGIYDAKMLGKQYFTDFGHEDYVAWLELLKKAGSAQGVKLELASYRVYAGSTSANKFKAMAWQWRIYRESQRLGWLRSAYLMMFYAYFAALKRAG